MSPSELVLLQVSGASLVLPKRVLESGWGEDGGGEAFGELLIPIEPPPSPNPPYQPLGWSYR